MPDQMQRYRYLFDGLLLLLVCILVSVLATTIYRLPRSAVFDMKSSPGLLPAAGLYDIESFPDREGRYRWTNGTGVVKLPNLGGATILRVLLAAGPARTAPVMLSAASWSLHIDVAPDTRRYALLLPPSAGDRIVLHIDSPTVDTGDRALGVLVSDLRLQGRGSAGQVPLFIWAAFLSATIGGYVLLRRAGWGRVPTTVGLTVANIAALAWQAYEGWRYSMLGPVLLLVGAASLAGAILDWRWPGFVASADQPPARLTRADAAALVLLLALTLAVRLPFIGARDPVGDIELSARQLNLVAYEGLAGAYRFGNDYMPLRLYMLRGLSLLTPLLGPTLADPLPWSTLALLKLPGLLADGATLALLFVWMRRWRGTAAAAGLAACYGLAPPVWINVAWWGQVDAWLMLPLLATVLLLDRARGRWSWLCWAAALLIKPQAIIIAPLLFIVTLRRYGCRGLAEGGGLASGLVLLGCAPVALAQGGAGGIVQAYVGAVERFPLLTNRAFNLWYLVTWGQTGFDVGQGIGPLSYRLLGMLLTGCAVALGCFVLMRRNDTATRLECAVIFALAFFLLPTQIHERYLFLSLAFLIGRCASAPRLLLPYFILVGTATLNILGTLGGFVPRLYRAVADSPWPLIAAAVNLLVFLGLLIHLLISQRRLEPRPVRRQIVMETL